MKNIFSGISFKWDKFFIRNLMIAIGVVLVWRGVWEITDIYLLPGYKTASAIASIIIGVLILYLPDGTLEHLSGYKEDEEVKKSYGIFFSIKETLEKISISIKNIFQ